MMTLARILNEIIFQFDGLFASWVGWFSFCFVFGEGAWDKIWISLCSRYVGLGLG